MEKNADKTNKNLKYCSPKNMNRPMLFNKETIILLINAWNASKEDKIIYKKTLSISTESLCLIYFIC